MPRNAESLYPFVSSDQEVNAVWANDLLRALVERDLVRDATRLSWSSISFSTDQLALRSPDADAPDTGSDGHAEFPGAADRSMVVPFVMPSTWVTGTPRVVKIRWSKATSAAGAVDWQMRHRYRAVGVVPSSWSSWSAATVFQSDDNTADLEANSYWEVSANDMPYLATFEAQIKRLGSTDGYSGAATISTVSVAARVEQVGGQSPWHKIIPIGT